MPKIALFVGGELEWFTTDFDYFVGVDRACLRLLELGLPLDLAVGDFDSVSRSELEMIQSAAKDCMIAPAEKDDTDTELALKIIFQLYPEAEVIYSPAQVISMKDAGADGFQVVPLTQSEGYISAEYAYLYPPGIPMLVPGERITAQIREHFQWYMERTYEIQGVEKEGYIEVWTHG